MRIRQATIRHYRNNQAFTCVIIVAFLRSAGAAAEDALKLRDVHWGYIRYPQLVLSGESDPNVEFMISCHLAAVLI